jgi:hypothetical protein
MLKSNKLLQGHNFMSEKKTRNLWPLLFIGIFGFTFSMIIWTVISTSKAHIVEDQSFNSSYHKIDRGYNEIYNSTQKFKSKYNIKIVLNKKNIPFELKDAFVSARELKQKIKKNKRATILHTNNNNISFFITDKKYRPINNAKFDMLVMNNINQKENINLTKFNSRDGYYKTTFSIPHQGRWSITGNIEVDGIKGYFFFKDMIIVK